MYSKETYIIFVSSLKQGDFFIKMSQSLFLTVFFLFERFQNILMVFYHFLLLFELGNLHQFFLIVTSI